MRAWENFLTGDLNRAQVPVRDVIHDSWQRCATAGVDSRQSEAPMDDDKDRLARLRLQNDELLYAAQQTFGALGQSLDNTGAMLVLADSAGVLLDVVGDKQTVWRGMDIHLGIGGCWTEDVAGTNGIGTALSLDRPVFVHAAEHFCAGIKSWTCAGAPIHDPFDNKIIGVIDLSGPSHIFQLHNPAFVENCARAMEERIAEQQTKNRLRLLEAFIGMVPRYKYADGLVIIDVHGRPIYVNNLQSEMLGAIMPSSNAIVGLKGQTPQQLHKNLLADIEANLPKDMGRCHLSPLRSNGDLLGVALVFPELASAAEVSSRRLVPTTTRRMPMGVIGSSAALQEAVDLACRAAQTPSLTSVLIEGETGVGKELIARLIHSHGGLKPDSPFVPLNCGAVTRELFGSELFGHVGGAFTGASREGKMGAFERANGGVLSLDEIGEMPLDIQPYLLRALEERSIRRLGDGKERPLDLRVVASTNRDLRDEAAAGRFRWDLYYRISAIVIRVPPLRERGDDILLLADYFNHKIATEREITPLYFSADTRMALQAYAWPGNVRELRNIIERLYLVSKTKEVTPDRLPEEIFHTRSAGPLCDILPPTVSAAGQEAAERAALRAVLQKSAGNLSQAAQILGISRPTLYRKLELYGIRRSFTER